VIAGILLAAGRAARFGSQKLLARLPDQRLVVEASAAKLLSTIGRVIAVTNRDEKLMRVLDDCGCQVVLNARASEGMGTSIAAGVEATSEADAWIIVLGDMPYIQAETIAAVKTALEEGASIVVPVFHGKRGHPVGFSREHYEALSALEGDEGARGVVQTNADSVRTIDVDDAGVIADVDVPTDLR
jgi:molybdenum cofactor cytidylyltransferase